MNDDTKIIVEFKGEYVHATSYGISTFDISLKLWQKIVEVCTTNNCFNVLGEGYTEGPTTMDGFKHFDIFKQVGIDERFRIAWAHLNPDAMGSIRFIRNVLQNRGYNRGEVFDNLADAKAWLLGKSD